MSTPTPPEPEEDTEAPVVRALEPRDFHVGLTAAEAAALIPKEVG